MDLSTKKKKEYCIKFPTIPIYSIVKHTIGPTLWTGVLYSLYIVYYWLRHKYTSFFFFFFFFLIGVCVNFQCLLLTSKKVLIWSAKRTSELKK